MADTQIAAGMSVRPYYGTEAPIAPAQTPTAQRLISFTLEPYRPAETLQEEETLPALLNYNAPEMEGSSVPLLPLQTERAVIFDIETSGLSPQKDRLVCIGAKDPTEDNDSYELFTGEKNEEQAIREFLAFIKDRGYSVFVGINPSFDLAFLLWKCMRYGIPARELFSGKIIDLQDIIKKGVEYYLPSGNKVTKLNDMLRAMFNREPPMEDVEALELVAKGDDTAFYQIVGHHTVGTAQLYRMWAYTTENSFGTSTPPSLKGVGEANRIPDEHQCTECLQLNKIEPGQATFACKICGRINTI